MDTDPEAPRSSAELREELAALYAKRQAYLDRLHTMFQDQPDEQSEVHALLVELIMDQGRTSLLLAQAFSKLADRIDALEGAGNRAAFPPANQIDQ